MPPAALLHKVVSALPGTLERNSLYLVRAGTGFDLYATNDAGTIVAYGLNPTGSAAVSVVDINTGARLSSPLTVDVPNVAAVTSHRVLAWIAGAGAGRDPDELEEPFAVTGVVPTDGTVSITVIPLIGPVHGTFRVAYQLL